MFKKGKTQLHHLGCGTDHDPVEQHYKNRCRQESKGDLRKRECFYGRPGVIHQGCFMTIEHIPLQLCHFQDGIERIDAENKRSDINGVDSVHQKQQELDPYAFAASVHEQHIVYSVK